MSSSDQLVFIAAAFVILVLVTILAWREWLGAGKVKAALLLLAGISSVALLWFADVPPDWFDGSGEGYWIAGTFLAMSILGKTKAETSFAFPLLSAMGVTMLVLNLWTHF